ncbi:MAG: ABC transporter ATP-binding protein [Deltaproteobacteria bacterium]|nr:ABC transporter ATP-binding protein [Deltaproteobacteria bacterium]
MEKNDLIIHLENITFSYPGCDPVLEKLNLQFYRKNRIGLMGPNGSGKTTLFHIIMGLLKPSAGKIEIFNTPAETETDFRKVREKIGLLFQDADDQLFSPTVLEDVAFGPLNLGKTKNDAIDIARNTLDFLGLNGFEDRITYKLSGGEKKLVSLATVLAMEPEVLLLDEPTSGLDDKTRSTLKRVLLDLDLSYTLISHDIDFLYEITDSIYTLENGKILFDQDIHAHQHIHAHPHGAYTHEHK